MKVLVVFRLKLREETDIRIIDHDKNEDRQYSDDCEDVHPDMELAL